MVYSHDFAVIGGDLRFYYLANHLAALGFKVIGYGLETATRSPDFFISDSLESTVTKAPYIIGPIPFSAPDKNVFHKENENDMSLDHLFKTLHPDQTLFAGVISKEAAKLCKQHEITYYDFMKQDSLAIDNSIATAEGVIAEAIMNQPLNLHGSQCLVLGYGRCAKTLAYKLKGLCASTTICARKETDFATANSLGFETVSLDSLPSKIENYDFIFNSVPALILTDKLLNKCKPTVAIYDIATAPGGIDFGAAKRRNIKADIYPGLPGKYSPGSSAIALADYILTTIKRKEVP